MLAAFDEASRRGYGESTRLSALPQLRSNPAHTPPLTSRTPSPSPLPSPSPSPSPLPHPHPHPHPHLTLPRPAPAALSGEQPEVAWRSVRPGLAVDGDALIMAVLTHESRVRGKAPSVSASARCMLRRSRAMGAASICRCRADVRRVCRAWHRRRRARRAWASEQAGGEGRAAPPHELKSRVLASLICDRGGFDFGSDTRGAEADARPRVDARRRKRCRR